jgi:hypothetical protein
MFEMAFHPATVDLLTDAVPLCSIDALEFGEILTSYQACLEAYL